MSTQSIPMVPINDRPDGFEEYAVQSAVLRDTLTAAGIELGAYERQIIDWLANWEWATIAVICSWVARAAMSSPPASPVALPSRFDATPAEVDQHLRRILAEDTYLRFQQCIGGHAVAEATKDMRMEAAARSVAAQEDDDRAGVEDAQKWHDAADHIDPLKHGGPYPSKLLCSQHNGFRPCPGAPDCTPKENV